MKSKTHIYLSILLIISIQGFSQQPLTEREYIIKYKKAVQLYANQKYPEAQDELTPLTLRKYNNAYSPYVHYYHALSSIKLKRNFEARVTLRQLIERYPDWKKIEEAYYLYSNANFADNYLDEGIENADKITLVSLKKEATGMEYSYLKNIRDIQQLKQLNQRHANNAIVGKVLVDAIQATKRPSRDDLELSDKLTNQFNLGNLKNSSSQSSRSQPVIQYDVLIKDNVNIAVLLPFRLSEFDANKRTRANQYVYEIYEGMKLAKEKLANERITLNLFAFDIDKDADDMLELANSNTLAKMDVLIGPLYPEVNKIASTFAQEKQIVQVHPLSNNSQLINNQAFTFLASPSYAVQAQKAIDFITSENPSKSVAIYYGTSRKDSTFAYSYRDQAMEKGLEITAIRKFSSEADIDTKRKAGHIFIAGSDENIGAKIILALDKKKMTAPVVATSTAFDFETTSLATFNRQLYLIQPDFIDGNKDEVKNFRSEFINEQNMIPSYYSYWGYDMALFYSRMLINGRANFRKTLDDIEYTQGYTLSGFDYTGGSHENQIVPIIKYQDGKFIEVAR